ncbi:MAG: SMC-Scp complex subunit ScpB [Anaerolineales bacterium]|nr:SMC-Scp complex subunit ScpB [Anaerolineales bacterium]QYK50134.1 MAG: SMC-Scp complex subunit ScpB [Anaerolineales bacterium]
MAAKKASETAREEKLSLEARIEALLFVAPGLVAVNQLAAALEVPPKQVEAALPAVEEGFAARGIRLQRYRGELRLISAPEAAPLVERFLHLEASTRLSAAALECLAIVAYQQPITRPQIDSVRGVNSDSSIRSLLTHGLVEEAGRADGPGRPILYSTTSEFLQHFGLSKIEDLPKLNLENLASQAQLPDLPELKS